MEGFEKTCPYCGQEFMADGDPRMVCRCMDARKYRKILEALKKSSEEAAPMYEIAEDVMSLMKECAHLICDGAVDSVTVKLADRTTVVIGAKVTRTARLKVEEKVDG